MLFTKASLPSFMLVSQFRAAKRTPLAIAETPIANVDALKSIGIPVGATVYTAGILIRRGPIFCRGWGEGGGSGYLSLSDRWRVTDRQ